MSHVNRAGIMSPNIAGSVVHCRDVPDIRFRLAGYPAIFHYPVPVPVAAKLLLLTDTGYITG